MKIRFSIVSVAVTAFFLCNTDSLQAGVKKFYSQDYESQTDASLWTSPNAAASLTLQSGDATYGKFIQFAPGTANDRSCQTLWYKAGSDFYGDFKSYTVEFDANITAGNNHRTTELAVMSEGGKIAANNNYAAANSNAQFLFDLTNTTDATTFVVCGDATHTITLPTGVWCHYKLQIDAAAKTVAYTVINNTDNTSIVSGTYTLPDATNYKAIGIYYLSGRYQGIGCFDNIKVSTQLAVDVANDPKVELTKVKGSEREYTISYGEEETLHYTLPGGSEQTVQGGKPVVVTVGTSGQLSAYTTNGDVKSNVVNVDVVAEPVQLAVPTFVVSGLGDSYKKTYTLTEDNSGVLLNPIATLNYVFTPSDGSEATSGEVQGDTVTTSVKGTFTITASAEGYTSNTLIIADTVAYKLKLEYNFANMTREQLVDNSYLDVGKAMTDARWGLTAALNFVLLTDDTNAPSKAFPGLTLFTNKVPTIIVGHGLMAPLEDAIGSTKSLYGTPLTINNGTAEEYAVYTCSNNYGASVSNEVVRADKPYSLYRFSTLLTDVKVYAPLAYITGISESAINVKSNGDYYNMNGIKMQKPLTKGVYIHDGKKFVIH
jgi:hypothetical protein